MQRMMPEQLRLEPPVEPPEVEPVVVEPLVVEPLVVDPLVLELPVVEPELELLEPPVVELPDVVVVVELPSSPVLDPVESPPVVVPSDEPPVVLEPVEELPLEVDELPSEFPSDEPDWSALFGMHTPCLQVSPSSQSEPEEQVA